MNHRYLSSQIESDLVRKMVFLGGPRQSGKTTIAKRILREHNKAIDVKMGSNVGYLNWDIDRDRSLILKGELPKSNLWVFDEIHKYKRWRNYLKGVFDDREKEQKILVTGSSRLDYYRFGGDSLQGRYTFLRLHPLSLAELGNKPTQSDLKQLLNLGPFPEPFFEGSQKNANRWTLEYRKRLVREEITSLENVSDIDTMELLANALRSRVSSPLSINSLREDLRVAHRTASNWIAMFERNYLIYRIAPFGPPRMRAVQKEQKHYHFDYNQIDDPGARFENLFANHLYKWVQFLEDTEGREIELRYYRDTEGREVDFVIVEKGKPTHVIEVKLSEQPPSSSLKYLKSKFPLAKAWQVHFEGSKDYQSPEGIRVAPARLFLAELV